MLPANQILNGSIVNRSKISPPFLPKILARPRLLDLFIQNEDKKLILIIGQAAQGKSTTAASWYFQVNHRPSVWINIEPEEADSVNLFYLLVQALHQERKEKEVAALLSLPSQTRGPREDRYRYREWASSLFATFNEPFQFFLDGLDRLPPQAESFGFLQTLIEQMPAAARFIMMSRDYPPLTFDFQQLKMGRLALILKNEDLAFTRQEIKQYFRELCGLSLSRDQLERVFLATEGWIGGIILLSETLSQVPTSAIDAYLGERLPDRFHRETFQYFGKEIFSALTPARQNLLMRSSILERLDPEILRDLFQEENGLVLLKEMTRKNLFVRAFPDPGEGVVFRYHQLFKDFLGAQFRSQVSEEELRKLQARAGAWYEEKGDLEKAIGHYLEARDYPKAAALIKQIGLALIKRARLADLFRWLQALPRPVIQEDPWLLLFNAQANRFISLDENIRTLKETLVLFKDQGDRSGLFLGMGLLIEAEFVWGRHRPELIREAEEILNLANNESCLYERAFLWRQIGWVHSLRGNPRRGYWACQQAYLLANQIGDPLLKAGALAHAVTSLSILGEFRKAERLLQELNSSSWRFPQTEALFNHSISRVMYLILSGDPQTALELCATLLEEIETRGLTYLYPWVLFHKQLALVYSREHRQADEISKQLLNLFTALNNGFLKALTIFYSGISAYWSDRENEARDLIDQVLPLFVARNSYSELCYDVARLARGLLNDRPEHRLGAIKELREVLHNLEAIESHLFLTECHLALGLLYREQGLEEQAREHLQKGFQTARQREFRHFMVISPRDTVRACLLAQELLEDGNEAAAYAARLVTQKFGRLAETVLEESCRHPNPRLREKALEYRRSLHRADRPLLRIETFGGLCLYFNGALMDDAAWFGHQPRQLLTAILSQKSEKIQKETLVEILWPDEKPGVGEKNFKTTLQRLRKSLEPDISSTFGSSYIHLHHNLVFLDKELCRVDCRSFMSLSKEGEEKEKAGDLKGALDCFSLANDLYQGDFIAEDLYSSWVERRREDLKNIYLDLLLRTARYHEQAGAFKRAVSCLKQALEADPLLEEACCRLMTLYAGKNQYNEALRVFDSCRKALKTGLNTRPDPATTALYQGIREQIKKS